MNGRMEVSFLIVLISDANFADVLVLFMQLFNILFDETYDLKLSTGESVDQKIGNWNKINAVICFNYFQ